MSTPYQGWGKPATGYIDLRLPAIRSPNFVTGVSGWTINQDGSVEFTNGVFRGVITNTGTYIYSSSTPAAGNLLESLGIATLGTDPSGLNAVLPGDTRYHNNGAGTFVAQQSSQSLVADLWQATSAAGPYTEMKTSISFTNEFTAEPILEATGHLIAFNGVPPGGGNTQSVTIVPPSGDTTGAKDLTRITNALNLGAVQLLPGTYYVNAPIQLINGATIRGTARPPVGKTTGTIIQAVGSINSVLASASWVNNVAGGNTGCYIADLKIDGNNTAVTGLTLTTFDALCQNVNFENCTFQGVELDAHTQSGATGITTDAPNNRFIDCTFSNCGQDGIRADDRGNVVFTDGYVKGCTFATMSGTTSASAAIALDHAGGWIIDGNHFYGLSAHAIKLGVPSSTRVVNNYFESWGQGAAAGTWRAIDMAAVPVFGGTGSIVAGNVFWLHAAPGNAGSTIEAVHYFTPAASTNPWVTTGNVFQCDPVAGFVAANAVIYENAGATSVTRYGTGGNEANGGWTNTQLLIPAGGTITNTGF